jgi:hypothetical protein
VVDQVPTGGSGQRLTREVVGRGTEPSTDDDEVHLSGQPPDGGDESVDVVTDREVVDHLDAVLGEASTEPRRVGVGQVAEQQLAAHRQHRRSERGPWPAHAPVPPAGSASVSRAARARRPAWKP